MARAYRAGTSFAAAAAALLIVSGADCQTSQEAAAADSWESRTETRAALLAAGDADSLEAAALLTPKVQSAERLQLVLRAAAAAPARPDLAWLALATCIEDQSCDVTPLEARLRAADPGNGAAWMGTLSRAAAGTPEFAAALGGVAGSERFDIYWNPFIVHIADALRRTGTMKDQEVAILAIGLGAAQAVPALHQLSRACRDVAAARPEDLGTCRKLSGALRHSDTLIVEGVGLSLARRAWAVSSDEYRLATAQARSRSYLLSMQRGSSAEVVSDAGMKRYLELLATCRTEQEALVAALVARGIDPNPPAGWTEGATL